MLALRLILISVTSLLVYSEDSTTSIPNDLPALLTVASHRDDTDASTDHHRHGRMSLHAELPASKAKREQALRNILAAKRRQALAQRPGDQLRGVSATRLRADVPKDATDVLEGQETRHGVYVAAPGESKVEIGAQEEASEPLIGTAVRKAERGSSLMEGSGNLTSKNSESGKQTAETTDLGRDDRTTVGTEIRHKASSGFSRSGHISTTRNGSQHLQRVGGAKIASGSEPDPRKSSNNHTVMMSDSLYKHFRPVESNVPIEEMTQFLYFGQKLSPETQNTTSSNSVEVTPTVSPVSNSRRRFVGKRLSTTTTQVPVPTLEEIINEEMNIAIEKQTIERNKIPNLKVPAFRNPSASSLYYRKPPTKPADPTIVSNVIGAPETRNASESDAVAKGEGRPADPSAHASSVDQVLGETPVQGKGGPASHEAGASGNAAGEDGSTQISNETRNLGPSVATSSGGGETGYQEDSGSVVNGHAVGYPSEKVTLTSPKDDEPPRMASTATTDHPETRRSTTLRIVVGETSTSKVGEDRGNLALPGAGSPPVALPAQQHVYAYTITNVTRLLRNYSGPGVSSKEEGEQHRQQGPAPLGTAEISDGSSSGIVATRSRSDLSAGSAAEGVTTLEGEQSSDRSGDHGPRSDPDAASRGETSIRTPLEVNKPRIPDSEAGQRDQSSVGPVSAEFSDEINARDVDQRMLLKSASAVLNQRPSEEPIGKGARHRNQPRRHNFRADQPGSKNHRRPPPVRNEEGEPDSIQFAHSEETDKSTAVRSDTSKTSNESLHSNRPTGNVTQSYEGPKSVNGKRNFEESLGQMTPDMLVEQSLRRDSAVTDNNAAPDMQLLDVTTKPSESRNLTRVEENFDGSKGNGGDKPNGYSEVRVTSSKSEISGGSYSNSSNDGVASEQPGDRAQVLRDDASQVEARGGTIDQRPEPTATSGKETVTVQSTILPSLFSVTPRILSAEDVPAEKKGNAVTVEESVTQVPVIRTTNLSEANRPFGIAEDLSPSEIQQMYRSPNTVRPEVTTIPNPEVQTSEEGEGEGEGGSPSLAVTKPNGSRSGGNLNGQGTVSVERSPEVRGRNLSDKSRDKDNVLPIMHLYNGTSIFNGTSSPASRSSSHGIETLPVILPVAGQEGQRDEKGPSSVTATSPATAGSLPDVETAKSKAHEHPPPPAGRNPGAQRLPDSLSNKPDNSTRHRADQPAPHEPGEPSYSNRGSGLASAGVGTNRTRHQWQTHQTPVPMFNSSTFDPAVNRTYLASEGDTVATQETVAVVSYILATLVVFPIAVGVGLILRRLIIRNRKMLEESDTSSEISCRKDGLNLEKGDFKTSIEKAITKLPRIQHLCHEGEKPPPPPSQESRWEFPRDKLRLQTVLGQGNFGQVWKAEADDLTGHQGTTRLVAVKTVKEGASSREKEDLVRELEIMQQLGNHPNVVTLLGCCTEEEPHYLILEYVMYGKLLAYLRDHRTRQDFYNFSEDSAALTSRDLTVFGYCVARGMEYLASKKIIHRDLAARNVLVDHNKLCKIADFGMSRFANEDGEIIETRHGRNALPIRWMAPESLIYSLFTTKTDVWSFGILMWEIVTLGSTPYPDMTAREVMRNVQSGYRLERPSHCRSELFRVISRCWQADPDRRPEFQVLRRDLAQLLEDNMNGHYVDLESFASECTD
ncbi:uncharacterized protein LOC124307595 isoform X1 [Neodiprion virginianus]|uniref:uncharacterized protein LOC124307595 isoform X1 n=1 Tax=Neodiprion virginianus TaxID=2961670 RepID=UPI001EE6F01A|nr:uncharacterized protein LOC124307595 isoform X1 [Neodiprion virginianus]